MVLTIRRVSANPVARNAVVNLFGSGEAAETIRSLSETYSKEAYQKYVSIYEEQIKGVCGVDSINSVHFCFAKAKRDKDAGDQFFMVFCNHDEDLKSIKSMKDAMMINVQTSDGGLRHTDFYSLNDIAIPLGRKTTDEEEANTIYEKFNGTTVTLGKLKEWIVYKSPYTFHSRALGFLERNNKLKVTGAPDSRRRGNFQASTMESSPNKNSNSWELYFISSEETKSNLFY